MPPFFTSGALACLFLFLGACSSPKKTPAHHPEKPTPAPGGQAAASPAIANRYITPSFLAVSENGAPDGFSIVSAGTTASIHYHEKDAAVVGIAARALRDDIERVSGSIPVLSTGAPPAGSTPILIGTLGHSPLIDSLVAAGKLDVSKIKGHWESYLAAVVADPLPGIARALVIVGADRRGTAFGTFALSEAMGVSPWYWWGDVPTPRKASLHVAGGTHLQPSPAIKYRGIFLNDEDWGLQPWAAKTFEPETGNIGPKTYATIYELLLRLHANVIWPAMHEFPVETTPFYLLPQNKVVADNYAIIVSTSHHEPMLRNSHEFDEKALGPYDYWTNRPAIYKFWDQRVRETAGYENIYTVGMRGRSDVGMLAPANTTDAQKAAKIQNEIIPDQRRMLADHVNPDPAQVPQIFIPYKETLVQYQSGLKLPDDITILWPDDNHGYIRQLSNPAERARSGGSGVYYHLSYWGIPASYLWFCTTPPAMTHSEMIKAWDFDARRMWIVNVGDIKPHEIGTDFFLRLARNPETFRDFDQRAYLTEWSAHTFGPRHAAVIAEVLGEYYRLNIRVRPEHLVRTTTRFDFTGASGQGDEAQARLDQFATLVTSADALYAQLPAATQPAFYSLVLFPLRASYQVNQKMLLAERSRLWAAQGRAATNALSAQALAADAALQAELDFYNRVNAGGKWNHMLTPMDPATLPNWAKETQSAFSLPPLGRHTPPEGTGLGVALEGSATPLPAGTTGRLPAFHRATDRSTFIDVFNTGSRPAAWTARPSAPWILLSQTKGSADARLHVRIDWARAPRSHAISGSITLKSAAANYVIQLKASNPPDLDLATLPPAIENNGLVVIEAENYLKQHDNAGGVGWRRAPDATVNGDGMTIQPVTTASIDPAALGPDTPSLTYEFHTFASGLTQVTLKCLPTHRITSSHTGLRCAISLNGDTPKIVDLHTEEYSETWKANVFRAYSTAVSEHTIATPGRQTIKLYMIDPGVVLDQLVIRLTPNPLNATEPR